YAVNSVKNIFIAISIRYASASVMCRELPRWWKGSIRSIHAGLVIAATMQESERACGNYRLRESDTQWKGH
ncbi:MAG: hypothetical protein Q8S19_07165, partial [Bacillota bacterium]|nr:hypothetical protein [Bacillota bacterium]